MATGKGERITRQLETLFNVGVVRELTDGQLLERFAAGRGEGAELAFAVLVERHGPMVLRVARGVLDDPNDAQDTFQATFLILVAKARGLWARDSLGPWLHKVAYRTATCQRSTAARRRRLDRRAAITEEAIRPDPADDLDRVLHEEINRLPERFRVAVVLCDLEGRTHEQAARALGWPVGTVKSRQARARDRLRERLTRRGAAPGLGLLVIRPIVGSSVSTHLVNATTAAAARFVLSRAIVPGSATALAREVVRVLTILRWAKVAPFVVALGAAASGVGLIAGQTGDQPGNAPKPVETNQATPPADPTVVEVKPGKLNFTLSERGVVEPSQVHDVLSAVEGGTTILHILPDGAQVKKGDLVGELDSASLRDQLVNQKIIEQQAEAASKVSLLVREVAEFAVEEYTHGVEPQERENLKGKIAIALDASEQGKTRLERIRLARKRFDDASEHRTGPESSADIVADLTIADRLDAAEVDLKTKTFDLETARGQLSLLSTYTRRKTTMRLQTDVERTKLDELAKRSAWDLEKLKSRKLERQIASCSLQAPSDGLLVYPTDPNRFSGRTAVVGTIDAGATVRERQQICSVISPAEPMRINARVRESLVDQVQVGSPVRITVEGFPNENLTGVVQAVAPTLDENIYATTKNKVYPTLIQIDQKVPDLRPGMGARVEIELFELKDVLTVPVASVVHIDDKDRVAIWTREGTIELREVTLGKSNAKDIEVKRGLKPGDRVFLDPAARITKPPQGPSRKQS